MIGRKSDTIVTGGENVAPAEVEAVLEEHPAVAEAGVFGRPDPQWGEAVTALRRAAPAAPRRRRASCARTAPRGSRASRCPKAFELGGALPRTASGKLLRRELT